MLLRLLVLICGITGIACQKVEQSLKTESNENLNHITYVSNFIKEFHRKLEKDLYPTPEFEAATESDFLTHFTLNDNGTLLGGKNGTDKNGTSLVNCNTQKKLGSMTVELVNSTRLTSLLLPDPNVTNRHMEGQCVVLLFYSKTCPFSCLAAPHFNALPRAFPAIKMAAVNAMLYQSFNTQYGIAGVPTLMLFHNGRPVAKFNGSEYTLKMFAMFIIQFTGMKPVEMMFVSSSDFGGPVPSKLTKERDYILGLAWAVILITLAVGISKSKGWRVLVEAVQNSWREAQAHHEHTE
ncbi:thioredoxin domain-containing protein 15 [Cimex lectularius]|uniref:Thioredoxin domain-containing protein n=1 Tax=Cimex lectularius TaxID=79782 RepID=A0A8I6RUR1_CIMLE|nr:thioredoxin domain-containing protein 15 [Cimex lectularius]